MGDYQNIIQIKQFFTENIPNFLFAGKKNWVKTDIYRTSLQTIKSLLVLSIV